MTIYYPKLWVLSVKRARALRVPRRNSTAYSEEKIADSVNDSLAYLNHVIGDRGDQIIKKLKQIKIAQGWYNHLASALSFMGQYSTNLAVCGLGIGFEINESPAATRQEILGVFRIAARRHVPIFAHLRQMGVDPITGSLAGAQEVLADALATGASLHFVHLGSSTLMYAPDVVDMIEAARKRGFDVTGEVYPYNAASTGIETAMFEGDWRTKLGIGYGDLEWPATGERLTAATFERYRKQGGAVIIHLIPDRTVDFLVSRPGVIIASDAMPLVEGKGHPRGIGTFARVLGRYVREKPALTLAEAIRKMTLLPAERLQATVPAMARKGRVTVGADADITIFDPATVLDRATFDNPTQASAGIPYVIVNGTVVVQDGEIVAGVHPGRAVKGRGIRERR